MQQFVAGESARTTAGRQEWRPAGPRRLRRAGASFLVVVLATGQACYAYSPAPSLMPSGSTVSLELTDRGRVELGQMVGSSAKRVEGVVSSENDSAYVLSVTQVAYLNGQVNQWTGETLKVEKGLVTNARQRKFSAARTALAAALGIAGVAALIVTRSLIGSGNSPRDPGPTDPPTTS